MIIKPLRPQKQRPAALLIPGYRSVVITTDEGTRRVNGVNRCYEALKALGGHTCYVEGGLRNLVHTTGARSWTADVWRGRAVTMRLYGTRVKVSSLRRTLSGLGVDEMYLGLSEVLAHLADQGVRPSSVSSMAFNLWRSTLEAPLNISFDPRISRLSLFGGRQEVYETGKMKGNFVAVDISKAYPSTMASRPYATELRRVSPSTVIDPNVAGLAEARVTVPDDSDHPFAPLPVRVAKGLIQWQYGEFVGVYSWAELDAAMKLGCDVEITKCWAPLEEVDIFSRWFDLSLGAGDLFPRGAKLFKAILNNLWGNFALSADDTATITWSDESGEKIELVDAPPKRLPHERLAHIAAETTSRVRVRMLLEGIYGDTERPVHVDTDGIICTEQSASRRKKGTGPGQWRDKTFMANLEVKAPQLYRHRCAECSISHPEWHYVAAGIPSKHVADFFEKSHPGFSISYQGLDQVRPSGRPLSIEQVRRYVGAADQVRTAAFGEELAL